MTKSWSGVISQLQTHAGKILPTTTARVFNISNQFVITRAFHFAQ